jgi:ATP-dependent Clp protease ATP-binding subunit ClpA
MTFERFAKDARAAVLAAAEEEAGIAGQGVVEAEHLLLALASRPELRQLGLDHEELSAALEREEEQSLAAVGVAAADHDLPAPRRRARGPKMATSTKLALQRAAGVAVRRGDRRIGAQHLLLGVLAAEHGRVPRALDIAGIDVPELRARIDLPGPSAQ